MQKRENVPPLMCLLDLHTNIPNYVVLMLNWIYFLHLDLVQRVLPYTPNFPENIFPLYQIEAYYNIDHPNCSLQQSPIPYQNVLAPFLWQQDKKTQLRFLFLFVYKNSPPIPEAYKDFHRDNFEDSFLKIVQPRQIDFEHWQKLHTSMPY